MKDKKVSLVFTKVFFKSFNPHAVIEPD